MDERAHDPPALRRVFSLCAEQGAASARNLLTRAIVRLQSATVDVYRRFGRHNLSGPSQRGARREALALMIARTDAKIALCSPKYRKTCGELDRCGIYREQLAGVPRKKERTLDVFVQLRSKC